MYQPNLCFAEGQNIKSATASPATEFVVLLACLACIHSGPTPTINSVFLDRVQGFLKRKSVLHTVECRDGDNIEICERLMQEHQVRRIPIVDAEDRIIGTVSQADLALKDKPERVSKAARGNLEDLPAFYRSLTSTTAAKRSPWFPFQMPRLQLVTVNGRVPFISVMPRDP